MGKLVGIDLGTTFSCVAHIGEDGQPEVLVNSEGERTTPSAILFDGDTAIVGSVAKESSFAEPQNYLQFIKRHMGERDFTYRAADGTTYTPESLSAIILRKIKQDAEARLGDTIDGAVITVPAYFADAQRQATRDAGEIAGLNVLGIINEPTAAALAYGLSKDEGSGRTVMVFDLGGGTFDVTILRYDGTDIKVLSTFGDRQLGGCDFDQIIIDHVIAEAKSKGIDVDSDVNARQDLQLKAEQAKRQLSSKERATIMLNVAGRPLRCSVTREDLATGAESLLFNMCSAMMVACEDAGIEYDELDKVLLVGGSTRMPLIVDAVRNETGIEPSSEINPDEAVAVGAAYHALTFAGKQRSSARAAHGNSGGQAVDTKLTAEQAETASLYKFTDVMSHGIGIIVQNKRGKLVNSVILPGNTSVPASAEVSGYSTVAPFQESLLVQVTQGDDEDVDYVATVGEAEIRIRPRQQIVPITVSVSCDENGIVHVYVHDDDENVDLGEVRIERAFNLDAGEVERSKQSIARLDITGD